MNLVKTVEAKGLIREEYDNGTIIEIDKSAFETKEQIVKVKPTLEELNYAETTYQTALLEVMILG
ncbi:hypothetical protein U5N28_07825 [Lysinibacillus telephonicus]|uniref:Uncharacterized protein n=1 Tax=Lysinibacillus telephonicus TaxID=1714840 RepID=A0A431UQH5_9BACI|nr:hypothetical protein [Lysinibacillus telephonicus]RTQ91617.1 hypothetical protein EKG35_13340 [Lysinibacillus telephonicus]